MIAQGMDGNESRVARAGRRRRVAVWVMLGVLAALLAWLGIRGYLSPELLFHFGNSLYC